MAMSIESAQGAVAITPGTAFPGTVRAIFVGTGGNITCTLQNDTTPVVLKNVPSGALLPLSVKSVASSGTTAADIVGLY